MNYHLDNFISLRATTKMGITHSVSDETLFQSAVRKPVRSVKNNLYVKWNAEKCGLDEEVFLLASDDPILMPTFTGNLPTYDLNGGELRTAVFIRFKNGITTYIPYMVEHSDVLMNELSRQLTNVARVVDGDCI